MHESKHSTPSNVELLLLKAQANKENLVRPQMMMSESKMFTSSGSSDPMRQGPPPIPMSPDDAPNSRRTASPMHVVSLPQNRERGSREYDNDSDRMNRHDAQAQNSHVKRTSVYASKTSGNGMPQLLSKPFKEGKQARALRPIDVLRQRLGH